MNDLTPLERVQAYYRDLNTGDAEKVARHFHPGRATTTTRGSGRTRSAQEIGEITEQGVKHLDASWHLEHGDRAGRRGRDRVDDALARPAPRQRAAARPRAPSGSSSRTG